MHLCAHADLMFPGGTSRCEKYMFWLFLKGHLFIKHMAMGKETVS